MLRLNCTYYALTLFALSQAVMGASHARAPRMYISNQSDGTVSVVDIEMRQVVNTVEGFVFPNALAWDGRRGMYVVDEGLPSGRVLVIDVMNHQVSEISGSFNVPGAIALNGGTGMYVSNGDGTISIIDTQTAAVGATIAALALFPQISSIAFDGKSAMYLADSNNSNNCVYVIDANSLLLDSIISVGDSPFALAWDGATGMYVANNGDDTVSVIDTELQSVSNIISVGDSPSALAWDGATGMYVSNTNDYTVTVIDTRLLQTVGTAISVGPSPEGMAWDVSTGMYVANNFNNTLSVIDTQTLQVVNTIGVGNFPTTVARAGIPVLLTVELQNTPEATMQLLGGAPVSLYGKPIPDLLPLTTVQIHVPDTGVVRYPVLANIAPSTTTALSTQVLQDPQSGIIALTIAQQ